MQPISKIDQTTDMPAVDRYIDQLLTSRDAKDDPLNPGPFPSLGFEGEKGGNYFMEIEQGNIKVTIWRIINPFGTPETFRIMKYTRHVFNGVTSWGASSVTDQFMAESLLHAQAIVHHCLTSKGNGGDDGLVG